MSIIKKVLLSFFLITSSYGAYLDKKAITPDLISEKKYPVDNRVFQDTILDGKNEGNINFTISFPKKLTKNENILILVDGLETGKTSLQYFSHPENYILIGYEYDKTLLKLRKKSVLLHLPSTRKAILEAPYQLVSLVKWIENQSWYNKRGIVFLGLSLGSIFVPATYHLAEKENILLGPCILAFGGAGIYDIFLANLKNYKILSPPISYFASLLFKPIDPKYHLSNMHNNVLIISGTKDENIPKKSSDLLKELTPEPKTIVDIDTTHMQPDREDIIQKVYEISMKWLKENNY